MVRAIFDPDAGIDVSYIGLNGFRVSQLFGNLIIANHNAHVQTHLQVSIVGGESGTLTGQVFDPSATIQMQMPTGLVTFRNVITYRAVTRGGDSGGALLQVDGSAALVVGTHIGGGGSMGVASAVTRYQSRLP